MSLYKEKEQKNLLTSRERVKCASELPCLSPVNTKFGKLLNLEGVPGCAAAEGRGLRAAARLEVYLSLHARVEVAGAAYAAHALGRRRPPHRQAP